MQLGARLVAVPDAAVTHPWWPERRPKVTAPTPHPLYHVRHTPSHLHLMHSKVG